MSSIMSSQGVVLATAVAVSGTVLLLALRLQKPQLLSSEQPLRSCISSDVGRAEKKKRRVRFAEDVVDPAGDGEVFRRRHEEVVRKSSSSSPKSDRRAGGIPGNRLALYNGMLRDRVVHRVGYSY